MTRELGRKISSIRIMRRPISYALVMACFVPVAYADVRPDASEAMTAAAEVHPQDTAATPKPSSALETAQPSSAVPSSAVPLDEAVEDLLPDYSKLTHHQLTRIGARWDQLGDSERRGLLNEVKLRMARQKGSERTLRIRTQRRYGRIVRRSDGQVLRIETKRRCGEIQQCVRLVWALSVATLSLIPPLPGQSTLAENSLAARMLPARPRVESTTTSAEPHCVRGGV